MSLSMKSLLFALSVTVPSVIGRPNNDLNDPGVKDLKKTEGEPIRDCRSEFKPNWNDCDLLFEFQGWNDEKAKIEVYETTEDKPCWTVSSNDDTINCAATGCVGKGRDYKLTSKEFRDAYNEIRSHCKAQSAGGLYYWEGSGDTFPQYQWTNRGANHEALFGQTEKENSGSKLRAREDEVPKGEKFKVDDIGMGIRRWNQRVKKTPQMPAGSEQAITETEENSWQSSVTTTTGFSVGTAFKGFDFGLNVDVSKEKGESHGNSNSKTNAFKVDCKEGQTGIIYWYPHWYHFKGHYEPSNGEVEVWRVMEGSEGEYVAECLG